MKGFLLQPVVGRRALPALLAAAASTVSGCTDRVPTEAAALPQPRLEIAPMPASAVLVDLEDLHYPSSFVSWHVRTRTTPRVDLLNFYMGNASWHGELPDLFVEAAHPNATMHFAQPLSRLSLYIRAITDLTFQCHDLAGREVATAHLAKTPWELGYTDLDIQGDGIRSCRMGGYGRISSMRLLPASQSQLKLTCTGDLGENRVTRGERIECVAKKNPESAPGQLTTISWSFEGEQRVDTPVDAPTWGGPMVRSGTVAVKARIGTGTEMTAVAPVTVVSRDWSEKTISLTPERVTNEDPRFARPCPLRSCGHTIWGAGDSFARAYNRR